LTFVFIITEKMQ